MKIICGYVYRFSDLITPENLSEDELLIECGDWLQADTVAKLFEKMGWESDIYLADSCYQVDVTKPKTNGGSNNAG